MAALSEAVEHPSAGRTLAVAAVGTLLVLPAFTTPLATLPPTAPGRARRYRRAAWILSGMRVSCAAGAFSLAGAVIVLLVRQRATAAEPAAVSASTA